MFITSKINIKNEIIKILKITSLKLQFMTYVKFQVDCFVK